MFRLIPGLENGRVSRAYGVMHRNTFVDAPRLLDESQRLRSPEAERLGVPVHLAGQIGGTEGYCEGYPLGAPRRPSPWPLSFAARRAPALRARTAFGALLAYATDPAVKATSPCT